MAKQNGYGNVNARFFNGFAGVNTGSGSGAAGYYPKFRGFGSSVHLTVLEKWDKESSWARWRKGFEYYSKTAFIDLQVKNDNYDPGLETSATNQPFIDANLKSTLYTGTNYEYDTTFKGWIFPTNNSDVGSYYVVKRTPDYIPLGTVTAKFNDPELYPLNFAKEELVITINPDSTKGRLLYQIIGERISDGDFSVENRTEATLKEVLTPTGKPSIYVGKTVSKELQDEMEFLSHPTTVDVTIPVANITIPTNPETFKPNQGINYKVEKTNQVITSTQDIVDNPEILHDKIIYLPNFYFDKALSSLTKKTFTDEDYHFEIEIEDNLTNQSLICFDQNVNDLPPSMHDVTNLPKIFTATNSNLKVTGGYVFKKDLYQPLFGSKYLTAAVVEGEVTDISYTLMPFKILKAGVVNNNVIIKSIPYQAVVELFAPLAEGMQLIFSDYSFAMTSPSTVLNGKTILDVTINPWLKDTKIFTSGLALRPAVTYSCGCPAFSKAIIAQPQSGQDSNERKTNRQYQYPMPSAMSPNDYEQLGASEAAGKFNSWETFRDKLGLRTCKHTIAAKFDDGLQTIEPSDYPTENQRKDFELKLERDVFLAQRSFDISYKRTGISSTEIVFALSTGLNLDTTEIAFIVLD
tara:strand:+ start:345 stop:2246 length:1902 start_codon:yes stop_codon:yes gene_type:complete